MTTSLPSEAHREAVDSDIEALVANIVSPRERFYLREPVRSALLRLEHDEALVDQALDDFFKRTLQ